MKLVHYTTDGEPWLYDTVEDCIQPNSPELGVKVPKSRRHTEERLAKLEELASTFDLKFSNDNFRLTRHNFSKDNVSISIVINPWNNTFYSYLYFNDAKCEKELTVETSMDGKPFSTKSDLRILLRIKKTAAKRFVKLARAFTDHIRDVVSLSPAAVSPRLLKLINEFGSDSVLPRNVKLTLPWTCYNDVRDAMRSGSVGYVATFKRRPSKTFTSIEWKVDLKIDLNGQCEMLRVTRYISRDPRIRKLNETARVNGDDKLSSLKKFLENDIKKMTEQVQVLRMHLSDCRRLCGFGFSVDDPNCSFKRGKTGPVVVMQTSSMLNTVELRVEKHDRCVVLCSVAGLDKKSAIALVQAARDAMKNAEIDDSIEEL